MQLMAKVKSDLAGMSQVEMEPKMAGRNITMTLSPLPANWRKRRFLPPPVVEEASPNGSNPQVDNSSLPFFLIFRDNRPLCYGSAWRWCSASSAADGARLITNRAGWHWHRRRGPVISHPEISSAIVRLHYRIELERFSCRYSAALKSPLFW